MKHIVVSGSTAYDFIMDYDWEFKDIIKAENLDNLSVWFLINNLKKEMWWTWLNIAYNLSLIGERPILLTSVWNDFSFDWYFKDKVNLDYINQSSKLLSASWYIITDWNWNQITPFFSWAMDETTNTSVGNITEEIEYSIIAPNQKEAMIKHVKESKNMWLKTFFDPGQQLFALNKEELEECSQNSNYLIVNEYEYNEFRSRIWKEENELKEIFEKIIITLWKKWSKIIDRENEILVPPVKVEEVVDPTWAWDAYRAWLIRWLKLWYSWYIAWRLWSLLSSHCIQFHGWQSHFVSKWTLEVEMEEFFWERIDLHVEKKKIVDIHTQNNNF